ncbi:hypothetical protein RRG08_043561 [Elysia crispata]|uniref:Uncharacterized protein n=1 Tax=Elysia crispata TaxID=231223 RepID=A0AAE0YFX0_9GAST|nr:hypothetical protein RRG08_043561 [Elysia crispata]
MQAFSNPVSRSHSARPNHINASPPWPWPVGCGESVAQLSESAWARRRQTLEIIQGTPKLKQMKRSEHS